MPTIQAVYQNGVFKPKEPVSLPDGFEVSVDTGDTSALDLAARKLTGRTAEQVAADRDRLLASSPPPRPLPPGKTLADVVVGQWPGDETDEQIRDALERLS
jgi:predicted DNA-binding antitoxin AbrB/MazE fold protein